MLTQFKDLGVGVGLRPAHYEHFLSRKPDSVSWVEVISENFMGWEKRAPGRALQTLEKIRKNVPVVLHGVSLNIGSTDPLNPAYLSRLSELAHRIEPAWISDHLCWTGVSGQNLHDLLPLPYTPEVLSLVRNKLLSAQEILGRRLLIENPSSYLQFEHSEMTEWDFLAELSKTADCGILLDINNVYVSSVNHGFDPLEYLKAIPKERVGQIHLAGHTNKGHYLIDTHDAPICEEVWKLYTWAVDHFGSVSSMVERDDNIPEWSELEMELKRISQIRVEREEKNETPDSFIRSAAI